MILEDVKNIILKEDMAILELLVSNSLYSLNSPTSIYIF